MRAGISTRDIEKRVQSIVSQTSARAYFKGYRGYPSIITTPVNSEVVHALPTDRRLVEGDILKVEFGLELRGEHAFIGWTFPIEPISRSRENLLVGTHRALRAALGRIQNNAHVGLISETIELELQRHQLHPCREFVGYRIGRQPTMSPPIPCFSSTPVEKTPLLKNGMVLAVIVISHVSEPHLSVAGNQWTVFDTRQSDSAYYSAMVRVAESGCEWLNHCPAWTPPEVRTG